MKQNLLHDEPFLLVASQASQRRYVSCIPTEILTRTFSLLLPMTLAMGNDYDAVESDCTYFLRPYGSHNDLLNVSRVCRDWRRVCLSTTSLWNRIWINDDDISSYRAEVFRDRSGNAPLEVVVRNDQTVKQASTSRSPYLRQPNDVFMGPIFHPLLHLSKLFPHGPTRMKTLRISCTFPIHKSFAISTWFSNPAPLLESLSIGNNRHGIRNINDEGTSYFKTPRPLFGGFTPSLRKLSVDSVEIPWDSAVFRNLTLLHICYYMDSPEIRAVGKVTVDRLLQILSDCPFLVSMKLENAGPIRSTVAKENTLKLPSKIDLPLLTNISVDSIEDMSVVKTFFNIIHTRVLRHCVVKTDTLPLDDVSDIFPQTLEFDPRLRLCNYLMLDLHPVCESIFAEISHVDGLDKGLQEKLGHKTISMFGLIDDAMRFGVMVELKNGLKWDEEVEDDRDEEAFIRLSLSFLRRFCVNPENIHALYIQSSEIALRDWPYRGIFEILTNVHCIQVWNYEGGSIEAESFTSFLFDEAQRADAQDNAVACPSVKMLIMGDVNFEEHTIERLYAFLSHRKERKAELQYLGLCCCRGISEEKVSSLRGLVKLLRVGLDEPDSDLETLN
ncbi:hypothetical protein SCHPADRAFT_249109 [Schizopora paradoxa]|uniref:F-box domain-containing protein n=1 Tax=Schizopora paradoxa TaxID=27342 RepID=A0A0H2RUS6_9AGAM|nr:hypothetical protein SCHPADRAFT_249109 [Schizopora paradoxa]